MHDPSIYFKKVKNVLVGMLVTHVDDIAATGTDELITMLSTNLEKTFEISKDVDLNRFLSI